MLRALACCAILLAVGAQAQPARCLTRASGQDPVVLPHGDWISNVAFSADGRWLARSEYLLRPHVYLWDLQRRCLLRRFARTDLPAHELAFTPDGRLLVLLLEINPHDPVSHGAIQLIDPRSGRV